MSLYPKLSESALALSSDEELEGWRQNKSPQRPKLHGSQGSSPIRSNGLSAEKHHTPRAERYSPTRGRGTVSLSEFERQYSRRSLPSVRGNAREKVDTPGWFSLWRKAKDTVYYIGRTNRFIVVLAGCILGALTAVILGELQLGKTQPRGELLPFIILSRCVVFVSYYFTRFVSPVCCGRSKCNVLCGGVCDTMRLSVCLAIVLIDIRGAALLFSDNDVRCPADTTDETSCIPQDRLPSALELANRIKAELHKKASKFHLYLMCT